ncbi:hypothetical protein CAS74_001422 [Pichia kudriavzevii]|uniref:Mitochondrial import receptor subunit TOM70 n=2 Tax=Pichia kudriavzevii TaxID=4909 RepID=A0A099P4Q1_PICKU|nr:uncharacterized protein C5L36_0A02230 [Pichia kudriavzevii]AWU73619.1 hypothetical protein C5L36_0A02230 [Pichia kudriavzevii]KGK39983.1 hypothetical protein JL09_g854 [Pichia kudriavzevii]OUT23112.1 hypothetical protein CAS74_001422 [Pichia kudriavzevii]
MSFIQQNKVAVAVSAVVGIGTLAGIVYYLNKSSSTSPDAKGTKKSKKRSPKKKKNSKASHSGTVVEEDPETCIYPINESTKLPEIDDGTVEKLPAAEKEKWALSLKEKGNEYFKAEQYEKAITYYTDALKCKKDHIFYGNRSACYYALKEYEKAIEDATAALEIKPDYSKCLLRRAHLYEDVGRFEDAVFDLTALSIYGGLADKSSESLLEKVLAKQADKMNREIYADLPKELPSSSSISSFLGAFVKEDIDLDLSKYAEASGSYFLAKALNELAKDTDEGYDEADNLFNQSVEQFEKDGYSGDDKKLAAIAYEYKGIFAFLKTLDNAAELVEKALSINARPRMYVVLALIAADKGDYLTADKNFNNAIAMDPNDPNIYYHYGQVFYLMGDLIKAEKNFEKAKELNPKNVFAYIQLACITYRHNDFSKCLELFNEAKAKFPTAPEIPNYLGEILFDKGDIDGATKQFDVAIKLQEVVPGNNVGVLPLINKSVIYQKSSQFQECISLLEKAVKVDPRSEIAWTNLGQLYLMLQRVEPAQECFEKACVLCRSSEDRKQIISLLESAKIQLKVQKDESLSKKVKEIMSLYSAQA